MVLNKYEKDGYMITEFTIDGKNVSSTVRALITKALEIPKEPPTETLEDKVNNLTERTDVVEGAVTELTMEVFK